MTHPENIHVGNWVSVEPKQVDDSPYFPSHRPLTHLPPAGQPLQVRALSLPFVALSDGEQVFPVDTREAELRILHRKYVKTMKDFIVDDQGIMVVPDTASAPQIREAVVRDTKSCPNCGHRMVERLQVPSTWILACRQCGFEGSIQ